MYPDTSRYAISLGYGVFDFDLSGTGQSRMWAARVERPLSRYVIAEGGVVYARPYQQFGDTTHFWIGELQVQAQLPTRVVAPYVGVGGGIAWDVRRQPSGTEQRRVTDPTFSAAVGARAWFTKIFGARAELRVRGVGGEFQGSSAEWTIGAVLRL